MDSFYRRFVRNFVSIAAPLHALFALSSPKKNRQGQPLPARLFGKHWSTACEVAFKTQTEVCVCPGIGICRFFKALYSGNCHQGLGAILSQDVYGQRRPVAYESREIRGAERNMENCCHEAGVAGPEVCTYGQISGALY